MLDILLKWNRWGSNPLLPGYKRAILDQLYRLVSLPETIVLTGIRRSGKSTLCYQLMSYLEQHSIPQKNMLYVNFEDPGFSSHLTPQLLDKVYRVFREEVCQEGKAYLFFDEIQVVPEWERWVNTRNETEDIKIFITGSSAKLMSHEISTLLTGRHISLPVHPLNFSEYLQFLSIELPNTPWPKQAPAKIQAALNQYIKWGGMPRVVLAQDDFEKRLLLSTYLDDILFKDVALRHNIRHLKLLKDLAVYLLTQTSCLITYKRLANIYNVSLDVIQAYVSYLEEAFLIHTFSICSLKSSEIQRNPRKIHIHDVGFRQIASVSTSEDKGKLIETLVYQQLQYHKDNEIFYWKKEQEIDLVIKQGIEYRYFVQVAHNVENIETLKREISALKKIHEHYPNAEKILIVAQWEKDISAPSFINVIPLWRFLVNQ